MAANLSHHHAMQRLAIWIAFTLLGSSCGGARVQPAAVGQPMPALALTTLDGQPWSPADARGHVLVVNVWASWCQPCRKGFPLVEAMAARHPDVRFAAISIDEDADAMRAFVAAEKVSVPVVHDAAQLVFQPPLSVTLVPTLLVIDAAGVVRHRYEEPSAAEYKAIEHDLGALANGR